MRRAFVQKWGQSEESEIQALSCLVVRFNRISEMEKANHKSYLHLLEGRSVSMNVCTNASAKHNSLNPSGQRAESPNVHTKGKHGHPPTRSAPDPWAVTVWSNLPAWKTQKIKLDHGRRNNNLNMLCVCGSDGRKKPTGYHPSPDGASEHRYAKSCGYTVCPAGELLSENNVLLLSLAHINFFHKDYPPSTCVDA